MSEAGMFWRPIDDEPLDAARRRRLDAGRLEPTVRALAAQFTTWLERRPEQGQASRMGLFGGLGQGKSSAVASARAEVMQEAGSRGPIGLLLMGPQFAEFNVSHFTAADLEWRFLAAVLLRRAARNLGVWVGLILLAFLVGGHVLQHQFGPAWPLEVAASLKRSMQGAAPPWTAAFRQALPSGVVWSLAAAAAAATIGFLWTRFTSDNLHGRARDVLVMLLARAVGATPWIVVVDDLDRADVAQQRAFLRALRRYSNQMRSHIVVCMDDGALLKSQPDPESPEELLRKTIDLVIRLPDRGREDVVTLVVSVAQVAVRSNPSHAAVLGHVRWLGHLVRVLLASHRPGQISPRMVKHVVNDVGQWACSLNLRQAYPARVVRQDGFAGATEPEVDDWCALLRLDGLYRLVPALRHDTSAVTAALEANADAAFERLLHERAAGLDETCREAALAYLQTTRMMQPAAVEGWYRLLSGLAPVSGNAVNDAAAVDRGALLCLEVNACVHRLARLSIDTMEHRVRGYAATLWPQPYNNDQLQFNSAAFVENLPLSGTGEPRRVQAALPASYGVAAQSPRVELGLFVWLCWSAVLATAAAAQRAAVIERMRDWLEEGHDRLPKAALAPLRLLVSREQVAAPGYWSSMSPAARDEALADDSYGAATTLAAVQSDDLLFMVGRLQGLAPLPARKALHLLAPHGHAAALSKLAQEAPPSVAMTTPSVQTAARLLATLWPPPCAPDAGPKEWARALRGPLGAVLHRLGWVDVVPATWLHGWYCAARDELTTVDCLRLLHGTAYRKDPGAATGFWQASALDPWLASVASLPSGLTRLADDKNPWTGRLGTRDADCWHVSLLVCAKLGWPVQRAALEQGQTGCSRQEWAMAFFAAVCASTSHEVWSVEGVLLDGLKFAEQALTASQRADVAERLAGLLGEVESRRVMRGAGWAAPIADLGLGPI